jgi:hypothetical protein
VRSRERTRGQKKRSRRNRQARLFDKNPREHQQVPVLDNELEQFSHFMAIW